MEYEQMTIEDFIKYVNNLVDNPEYKIWKSLEEDYYKYEKNPNNDKLFFYKIDVALKKKSLNFISKNNLMLFKNNYLTFIELDKFADTIINPDKYSEDDLYISNDKIDYLTGCCFFASANTIKKIGMLDEACFMYCEDMDYSCRAIENNIKIRLCPNASITHKIGRSSGGGKSAFTTYYINRNRMYVITKNKFPKKAFLYSIITRYIKYYIAKYITHSNDIVIKQAICDYRHGNLGKTM